MLGHLGATEPVLLVLEDLQWADESTLDLVAFLGHAIQQRRVLLVATYRSDEVRPGDHLYRLVDRARVRRRRADADARAARTAGRSRR